MPKRVPYHVSEAHFNRRCTRTCGHQSNWFIDSEFENEQLAKHEHSRRMCNLCLSLHIWMSRDQATGADWVIHWNSSTSSLDAASDKTIASITTMLESVNSNQFTVFTTWQIFCFTCYMQMGANGGSGVVGPPLRCGICDKVHTHTHTYDITGQIPYAIW